MTLTLETRQAQRMVKGRPGTADKPAIMGLIGFANRLRVIWHGARADDPYADWWLVKVHDALDVADLDGDELSLYKLIWDRFVASQMAAAEFDVDGVRVAPDAGVRLEDLDVVVPVQQVRCHHPRHAGSDDGDPHGRASSRGRKRRCVTYHSLPSR